MTEQAIPTTWSTEWPTEPGWYWVYGWPHGGQKYLKPTLEPAGVRKISNGKAYIVSGAFVYPSDAGETWWTPAIVPETPRENGGAIQ